MKKIILSAVMLFTVAGMQAMLEPRIGLTGVKPVSYSPSASARPPQTSTLQPTLTSQQPPSVSSIPPVRSTIERVEVPVYTRGLTY